MNEYNFAGSFGFEILHHGSDEDSKIVITFTRVVRKSQKSSTSSLEYISSFNLSAFASENSLAIVRNRLSFF